MKNRLVVLALAWTIIISCITPSTFFQPTPTIAPTSTPALPEEVITAKMGSCYEGLKDTPYLLKFGKVNEGLEIINHCSKENEIDAQVWNSLCWYGAMFNYPEKVEFACDKAIEVDPSIGASYDSRGIVRALNGNLQGAVEDFYFFTYWAKNLSSMEMEGYQINTEMVSKREGWIELLKNGENPFTDSALMGSLQNEFGSSPYAAFEDLMGASTLLYYGYVPDALQIIQSAEQSPDEDIAALVGSTTILYRQLCLAGTVYGYAPQTIYACEKSIINNSKPDNTGFGLAPTDDASLKVERGMARAALGDSVGALADFQEFINTVDSLGSEASITSIFYYEQIPTVRIWVDRLDQGDNPINPPVAKELLDYFHKVY